MNTNNTTYEAHETDETRCCCIGYCLVTALNSVEHEVGGVTPSNIGESRVFNTLNQELFFCVEHGLTVPPYPPCTVRDGENRNTAASSRKSSGAVAVAVLFNTHATTTTSVTSMYTIHTACQRKEVRCHHVGDSAVEVLN